MVTKVRNLLLTLALLLSLVACGDRYTTDECLADGGTIHEYTVYLPMTVGKMIIIMPMEQWDCV